MKFKEIAFTAYPVTDMARARAFYEGVLGLSASRTFGKEPVWVEYDIGPGCLAIMAGSDESWRPASAGPAAALEVDDFDGAVAKLRAAGVKFLGDPAEYPPCRMVIAHDPDGNRIAIHHRKAG